MNIISHKNNLFNNGRSRVNSQSSINWSLLKLIRNYWNTGHPERSEGSTKLMEILRFAQNDYQIKSAQQIQIYNTNVVQTSTFLQKNKEFTQKCKLFIWCEGRDLNPYGITTRPSNVRVCRFRHSRISVVLSNARDIITKEVGSVKHFLQFFKNFLY